MSLETALTGLVGGVDPRRGRRGFLRFLAGAAVAGGAVYQHVEGQMGHGTEGSW